MLEQEEFREAAQGGFSDCRQSICRQSFFGEN
ncbi:MAG: hypothetical protein PWQ31_1469, partial [Eubacteriales bacterium]|nr:hypothetical protein [Eubacteriales bacterium]